MIKIEAQAGPAGGMQDAIPQQNRTGCGVAGKLQVTVQVGIFHIRPGERKMKAGGNAECRFIHTTDHRY